MTVTGTMMLRSPYESDLSAFDYESVNLARQQSIVWQDLRDFMARPEQALRGLMGGEYL